LVPRESEQAFEIEQPPVRRRRETLRDEAGVIAKFGIKPSSIPDYLAVAGDSADGYPGIAGWGSKTAAAVFSQDPHLEHAFRKIGVSGIRWYGERVPLPSLFLLHGKMRCCFALLRHFESMFPCSPPLTICCGEHY
jgi:hypothetical protein